MLENWPRSSTTIPLDCAKKVRGLDWCRFNKDLLFIDTVNGTTQRCTLGCALRGSVASCAEMSEPFPFPMIVRWSAEVGGSALHVVLHPRCRALWPRRSTTQAFADLTENVHSLAYVQTVALEICHRGRYLPFSPKRRNLPFS